MTFNAVFYRDNINIQHKDDMEHQEDVMVAPMFAFVTGRKRPRLPDSMRKPIQHIPKN